MGTYTTNYQLFMPTVGEQGWGELVNGNFTTIDTTMAGLNTRVGTLETEADVIEGRVTALEDVINDGGVTGNIAPTKILVPFDSNGCFNLLTISWAINNTTSPQTSPTYCVEEGGIFKITGTFDVTIQARSAYTSNYAVVNAYVNGTNVLSKRINTAGFSTAGVIQLAQGDSMYVTLSSSDYSQVSITVKGEARI